MFRFLLLAALVLATGAAASAQTAPAKRPTTKPVARTHRSAAKPAAPLPAKPEAPAPAVRRPTGSTATADGKGQGVYAAPGDAVQVQSGQVESYRGEAPAQNPRKPIGNTLGSGTGRPAKRNARK